MNPRWKKRYRSTVNRDLNTVYCSSRFNLEFGNWQQKSRYTGDFTQHQVGLALRKNTLQEAVQHQSNSVQFPGTISCVLISYICIMCVHKRYEAKSSFLGPFMFYSCFVTEPLQKYVTLLFLPVLWSICVSSVHSTYYLVTGAW